MTRPMIRIHDLATGEIIDREMNDEEYESFLAEKEAQATLEANAQAQAEAKAALLERLGITEDEAKLLIG